MRSNFSRRRRDPKRHDENQRALDRLSYLGGILIPLPIISSILSMGDVYGPDGNKFFVFWTVAVPLAVLTVLLIYADTIRKAEVWFEIGADHVVPAPAGKNGSGGSSTGENTVPVEVTHSVTWRRPLVGKNEEQARPPQQENNVPFAVDHSMEERIIDMPPEAAAVTLQPADGYVSAWLPPWSMGWESAPSVILEQPADGSRPKAWKKGQLGWTGAMQTVLSKKFRDADDVPEGVPAYERAARRKANSY